MARSRSCPSTANHLAPQGMARFVLSTGSMSSNRSGEGEIWQKIIEADLVDCMVALPGKLFSRRFPSALGLLGRMETSAKHGAFNTAQIQNNAAAATTYSIFQLTDEQH